MALLYIISGSVLKNADMVGLCGAVHKIDRSHYCDRVYAGALVPEVISYGEYTHSKRISV